jgi:hypothetical protein
MRRLPTDARLGNVGSARQTARLTIHVEVGSKPISGDVDVDGKRTERFVGWTALAVLLEEARTTTECGGAKIAAPESAAGGER